MDRRSSLSHREGKNVTYKCNEGYHLRGPHVRACDKNGNWTGEDPTCEGEITGSAHVSTLSVVAEFMEWFCL